MLECCLCGAVYEWGGDPEWAECPHCGEEGPVEVPV